MNLRTSWKVFLALLALIGALAMAGGALESSGTLTAERLGPQGIASIKVGFFILFCLLGLSIVPLALGYFIAGQVRMGNGGLLFVRWLRRHERTVVYAIWILIAIGLSIALPAVIRDGFFR